MLSIIQPYLKPEFVVVAIVLYMLGIALKTNNKVKDKSIPFILGFAGIFLALIWVFATSKFTGWQSVLLAIFTSIIQGALVAGASNYVDQLIKQYRKPE